MDEEIKECVHHLGNALQIVLGYIEIEQCEKAKPYVKKALKHMRELNKLLHKKK